MPSTSLNLHNFPASEQQDAFFTACDRAVLNHVERVSDAYGRLCAIRDSVSDVLVDATADEWLAICGDWKTITQGRPERRTREWFADFWGIEPVPAAQWRRIRKALFT